MAIAVVENHGDGTYTVLRNFGNLAAAMRGMELLTSFDEAGFCNQDTGETSAPPREDYGSGVSPQERADTGISDLQIPLNPQVVGDCAERALQALMDEAQEMGLYDSEPATPIEPRLDGIVDERMAASFAAYCKTGNCED